MRGNPPRGPAPADPVLVDYVSDQQVAKEWGISVRSTREKLNAAGVPGLKIGGVMWRLRSYIVAFMNGEAPWDERRRPKLRCRQSAEPGRAA